MEVLHRNKQNFFVIRCSQAERLTSSSVNKKYFFKSLR
uniref:Uncharacterized protein n=1 Tax=virus sp. ctiha2 TaxID=2827299 RepID=A0A8S5RHC4_9VIRU|nr:MAG TPA: hypothetical protein [virus sp. ctiha2]DAE89654.1 MAG TPA: hypothetical protein [Bacteriophage sp.]DAX97718.1 MAG TPA: hypothetical protein [Caudoviricetes sp.]